MHRHVQECLPYQSRALQQTGEPLHPIQVSGPLPNNPRGNQYIIVVINYHTKWVDLRPLPTCTAELATTLLFDEPIVLQSDRGTHFMNELWQHLTKHYGIQHCLSFPYHPQSNDLVER